ncbi:helix-turn-helix domain-containing protein [Anaerococcus sp. NML200574]|uniref:Helix-turn-helix domain-containing protein n=1 Tax=Anaerococcus kampingae TaxID=3115614 RepID=A0ABW9MFI4_9FIRM|nr:MULTISPECIES: helix-turn-helix domain-containing protein [unclassified Anaerococcus]MCW6679566.1 helix-turn-helix domain-containing protein [Anaerococcus sp. NML200574]MCW6702638.1 helix-turn-helix domain-containing protein [Anaerococcus sp. NML200537]
MKKYSLELKKKVIKEYEEGEISLNKLARKYKIKSPKSIREWVRKSKIFGETSLENPKINEYPLEIKQSVIKCALTGDLNFREISDKFGIRDPKTVSSWVKNFQKEKNFPKINLTIDLKEEYLDMKKKNKKKDYTEKEIQEILEENLHLRIENDYLKELRRLVLEEDLTDAINNTNKPEQSAK